jgi:hypothetical protein
MSVAEQLAIIVQMMNGAGGCWGVDDVVGRRSACLNVAAMARAKRVMQTATRRWAGCRRKAEVAAGWIEQPT